MARDKRKARNPAAPDFDIDYYTEELGRPLQRKLLQRRIDELSAGRGVPAAAARDDRAAREERARPRRKDRPG